MENIVDTKVLFVITKSNLGGAQKYVYELACATKKAGGTPLVALGGSGEAGAPLGPLAKDLAVKSIPSFPIHNFMRNMSLRRDFGALRELIALIKKETPDVLHVTSSKAGGLGAFAGRICRVQTIIFTSHGLTFEESWRPFHQKLAIKALTWFTLLLAHESIMISSDTYHATQAMPFVKDKMKLIYNGIHPQLLVSKKDARAILSDSPQKPGTIWVGGIGELHPNKNWLLLIETMPHLPNNIYCVIIGDGEQRKVLQKRIEELGLQGRVFLTGFIENASSLLAAFDIFILPSYKEGLPYVLLEAGIAQCAVVCSDISGNTDIIENDVNGLLVEHTVDSLTTAITTLSTNKALRKEFGLNLHQTVTTKFSMDQMMQNTLSLYL